MSQPAPDARPRSRRALALAVAVLLVLALAVTVAVRLGGSGADGAGGARAGEVGDDAVVRGGDDRGPGGGATARADDDPDAPAPTTAVSPSPTPPPEARFTLVAAGDVLTHGAVLDSARTAAGHDFGPLLEPLDPWVRRADLALCHLEVPVAPDGTAPSGFPTFGAPRELVAALAVQGWDGCSTASNHTLDRGMAGLVATLDAFDVAGLGHAGTARTATEAAAPQVYRLERAGRTLTVAHLAATFDLNGYEPPADAPWAVTLLDADDLVRRAVDARAAGADLVVVSVHCCVEYVTAPSPRQVALAEDLAASGVVDLVIGHHAHVPQPVELLPGGPGGAGLWVAHGLGNLLSNQDAQCCVPETSNGVLVTAEVVQPADGPARVVSVGWTGTTVDRAGGHRVHALVDLPTAGSTLGAAEVADRAARVAAAVGPAAAQRTTPPSPTGPPPEVVPRPR